MARSTLWLMGIFMWAASALAGSGDPIVHIACNPKASRCEKSCAQSIRTRFKNGHPHWLSNCRGFAGRRCSFGMMVGTLTSCLNNQPLNEVKVVSQGKRTKVVRTDLNGRFSLTRLSRGSYLVWATRPLKKPVKLANCLKVDPQTTLDLGTICVCPEGTVQCGNTCCDVKTDDENCGACGQGCEDGFACLSGQCVEGVPDVNLTKLTNGEDADIIPGPIVPVGSQVTWTYLVENRSSFTLSDVAVDDDTGVTVNCPSNQLAPLQTMTCTAQGVAQAGQYSNTGIVTARTGDGRDVGATDMSHYFGKSCTGCPTETPTPAGTPTATLTATPTATPTATTTATATASASPTSTVTPTSTATPTPTSTFTVGFVF